MVKGYGYEAPAYRQAGVWFSVRGLRQILKTNNVTVKRYRLPHPYPLTKLYFLINL
jgi:hypothetical protein